MIRRNKTNKNLIIMLLVVLLLILAVGYAVFSEILTITGTAGANGTFDLEFQDAKVEQAVGVDALKTKAEISEDRNTLTVTVADLAYPGAGVEFSTNIVNVGSVPARVEMVTPINIQGAEALKNAIKIKGLDAITNDHPTLSSGEKCNIHFTVEWDKDSQADLGESDGVLTFDLQIQYAQKTDELFSGNTSHGDEKGNTTKPETPVDPPEVNPPATEKLDPPYEEYKDKIPSGLTATAGQKLGDIELPEGFTWNDDKDTLLTEGTHTLTIIYTPQDTDTYKTVEIKVTITVNGVPTEKTLAQKITGADYGKKINYSVDVTSTRKVDDWRIFSSDGVNVKIITTDFLPQTSIPSLAINAGLKKISETNNKTYCVNATSNELLSQILQNEEYWSGLAGGVEGATARGGPTRLEYVESWNNNPAVNARTMTLADIAYGYDDSTTLYKPHAEIFNGCYGYWLSTVGEGYNSDGVAGLMMFQGNESSSISGSYSAKNIGVRPIVTLPANLLGTVGDTVTIEQ